MRRTDRNSVIIYHDRQVRDKTISHILSESCYDEVWYHTDIPEDSFPFDFVDENSSAQEIIPTDLLSQQRSDLLRNGKFEEMKRVVYIIEPYDKTTKESLRQISMVCRSHRILLVVVLQDPYDDIPRAIRSNIFSVFHHESCNRKVNRIKRAFFNANVIKYP